MSNAYPKQFTIKFRNLPHFFPNNDVISACNLKDFKLSKLRHQLATLSEEIVTQHVMHLLCRYGNRERSPTTTALFME